MMPQDFNTCQAFAKKYILCLIHAKKDAHDCNHVYKDMMDICKPRKSNDNNSCPYLNSRALIPDYGTL